MIAARRSAWFAVACLAAVISACLGTVRAAEIKVVTSGAFSAAYLELVPEIERAIGHKLVTGLGASMGTARDAIPMRLQRGEAIDIVIMAAPALSVLIEQGKVRPDSEVDLAQSAIGMAVAAGAPKPDISTVEALKRTLLAAKSIAYSASASGVYMSTELFPKLGIAEQLRNKTLKIEGEPVGEVVARGEAELGFQQISELLPVKGIDLVGPLPPAVQRITVFAAGIPVASEHPVEARAVIEWLASQAAHPAISKSGLVPGGVAK